MEYISRVKSYAPRIVHVVVDVRCVPLPSLVNSLESNRCTSHANQSEENGVGGLEIALKGASTSPVEVIENVTAETFWAEICERKVPVIIRGASMGKAAGLWTSQYLQVLRIIYTLYTRPTYASFSNMAFKIHALPLGQREGQKSICSCLSRRAHEFLYFGP